MLFLISEKYNKKDFWHWWVSDSDDRLRLVKNKSGQGTEKKNIQKIFKDNKLDIVIQCNMKIVNSFNISLNCNNNNQAIGKLSSITLQLQCQLQQSK